MYTALAWLERHRGPEHTARTAASIEQAIMRAAENPELYVWVGSIHQVLTGLPRSVRRVLTRRPRYAVYYRYAAAADEIQILSIRGGGQLSPTAEELTLENGSSP